MKILMLTCTQNGEHIMKRLAAFFDDEEVLCCSFYRKKPDEKGIFEVVREQFSSADGIIFICATGIAVRSIAPMVSEKWSDPAVIVLDDRGKFCISLLSGHMGGANELAGKCASYLGATPVITTATDGGGLFSVDDFARKNNLILTDHAAAKEISVAVLDGAKVEVINRIPGFSPEGLPEDPDTSDTVKRVCISCYEENGYDLLLYPRVICLGIGCKKGTKKEAITLAVKAGLSKAGLSGNSVAAIASITLKQEEEGLLEFAKEQDLPLLFFTPEELSEQEGDFASSAFVERVTGVSNVCERSAVLCVKEQFSHAKETKLLLRKFCLDGVTVAAAIGEICE